MARGTCGAAAQLRPADHRARLVGDDVQQGPRRRSASTASATAPTTPTTRWRIATSRAVRDAARLGPPRRGGQARRSLLGVPADLSRRRPVNGLMVGCFLTPPSTTHYTYPPELKDEIARRGRHPTCVDVPDFRTADKAGSCARHLRDDREALRARPAPARHQAVGLLHDGRDGHRPRPSRASGSTWTRTIPATSRATASSA